jgi:hypothetical protein
LGLPDEKIQALPDLVVLDRKLSWDWQRYRDACDREQVVRLGIRYPVCLLGEHLWVVGETR